MRIARARGTSPIMRRTHDLSARVLWGSRLISDFGRRVARAVSLLVSQSIFEVFLIVLDLIVSQSVYFYIRTGVPPIT